MEGLAWHVGNGDLIDCWSERWIGTKERRRPLEYLLNANAPSRVSEFIDANSGT